MFPSTSTSKQEHKNSVNLLALDRGGLWPGGASMLIILQEMMDRLAWETDYQWDDVKPCEVFDMIGGSGMGGIIAILLGRLGMTTREAYRAHTLISEQLSGNDYSQEIKANKLEVAILKVLNEHGFPMESRILDVENQGKGCKTFVATNVSWTRDHPTLVRGYRSRNDVDPHHWNCYIWEAARATTADRQLYPDIVVQSDEGLRYNCSRINLGCNSSTELVIDEFKNEFPGKKIASLISVGSGPCPIPRPSQNPIDPARDFPAKPEKTEIMTLGQISGLWEDIADRLAGKYVNIALETGYNPYTRFNVEHGWPIDDIEAVKAYTWAYIYNPRVARAIDVTIERMMMSTKWGEFKEDSDSRLR